MARLVNEKAPDHGAKTYQFTKLPIYQLVLLNCCLVNEHDWNVVFDRIHTLTSTALQRRAVVDERDRCFAVGTGENLEQFRVDGHAGNI